MARSIPRGMAGILEQLELERPQLVSTDDLSGLCTAEGIETPARIVASRLRDHGWLLPTGQRGVWEFAPAEVAGPISSADPLLDLKAYMAIHPSTTPMLASQTAAWALGLADRVPSTIDVAFPERPRTRIPDGISCVTYAPLTMTRQARGVSVLAPESIVVCMVAKPASVRSWAGVPEWLPDVAYEMEPETTFAELEGRKPAIWAKTAYLMQGVRPDIAEMIGDAFTPTSKVRFGSSGRSLRGDKRWMVADEVLPFDPRDLEAVR